MLKRYGGGGTVVLYGGCLVVSLGTWVAHQFENTRYFRLLNEAVITTLRASGLPLAALGQAGLSDVTWGERKIAGTSLFRSRNYLLYQASILCELDLGLIDRYLRHPSREPDYRKGRRHADFLIGLTTIDASLKAERVAALMAAHLETAVCEALGGELIKPEPAQFANLFARVERAKSLPSGLPSPGG